eukprot:TRINITY_DN15028_c0_g1_i2.p1 TRINITY_DN15028_c0_g1~~TRINITY_DN15028_c0_g1_i2.p1  ORF type:complete len:756 (-),score=221.97 TRINITY_DN15028_c0_g1_i2:366-2633(-)
MADSKIYGDQLSYAAIGTADGGRMGRIRKVEVQKIEAAGGDASWDKTERSTKVGEVTDSLGRRRFHGAFTGGFSAGWFNSVGSKEGWTPQSFTSSRTNRAELKQSVDDFMDAEDHEDTAGRQLTTTAEFSSFAGERGGPSAGSGGLNIASTALSSLSSWGSGEPLGRKLLKTMGWKEGDPVGAKLPPERKRQIKEAAQTQPATSGGKKVYGAMLPPGGLAAFHEKMQSALAAKTSTGSVGAGQTWAPSEASRLVSSAIKKDFFGLGYNPHSDAPEFAAAAAVTLMAREEERKQQMEAQQQQRSNRMSFGDEDENDGLYYKPDMGQYDLELEGPTHGGSRAMNKSRAPPTIQASRAPGGSAEWLRRSFVPSTGVTTKVQQWFTTATAPQDFVPRHVFDDGDQGAEAAHQAAVRQYQASRGQGLLDHQGRAALLGEQPVEPMAQSLETEHREVGQGPSAEQEAMLREAAKRIADQGKGAFNPYPNEETKARRYASFVSTLTGESLEKGAELTENDEEKEEFCRVVMMFQPRESTLNTRFHSCDDDVPEDDVRKNQGKNPVEVAAAQGAYGAATRQVYEWRPAPLLCKRTNNKNPYPGSETVGTVRVETPAGFAHLPQHMLESISAELAPKEKPKKQKMALEFDQAIQEEQADEDPSLKIDKPSIDIFKAIFEDSDEEDEDEAPPPEAAEPELELAVEATPMAIEAAQPEQVQDKLPLAPPPTEPAPPEEQKIIFRKPPTKRRVKNRPTAKDFMKSGL